MAPVKMPLSCSVVRSVDVDARVDDGTHADDADGVVLELGGVGGVDLLLGEDVGAADLGLAVLDVGEALARSAAGDGDGHVGVLVLELVRGALDERLEGGGAGAVNGAGDGGGGIRGGGIRGGGVAAAANEAEAGHGDGGGAEGAQELTAGHAIELGHASPSLGLWAPALGGACPCREAL